MAEEEQAGRGTVREDRDLDLGWAAAEWAEVEAGREVPVAQERERVARAREVRAPVPEVCGKAAPAQAGPAQVPAVVREPAEEELGLGQVARVAGLAPVEVGERERVRVAAVRVLAEERERVREEADSAEAAPVLGRVEGRERAEVELARAERDSRENG